MAIDPLFIYILWLGAILTKDYQIKSRALPLSAPRRPAPELTPSRHAGTLTSIRGKLGGTKTAAAARRVGWRCAMGWRSGRIARILAIPILVVGGCTGEPAAVYAPVAPQSRTIIFQAPLLEGIQPDVRVRVTGDTREEFARWEAAWARAGFWHGVTFTGKHWLPTPDGQTARALRYWRDLREPNFALRDGGSVATSLGDMRYWRFRLEGGWFDCFAVNHFWTPSAEVEGAAGAADGYRDWLNGYYCSTDGDQLTESEIEAMLSGMRIDRTHIFPAVGGG